MQQAEKLDLDEEIKLLEKTVTSWAPQQIELKEHQNQQQKQLFSP